jgi:hypothetical protein
MPEIKLVDRIDRVSRKRGNGLLRREVWIDDASGRVTRYNLAYINHNVYHGDNGRVLGYDNKHGFHHRHFMGQIEEIIYVSFEDTERVFEKEWLNLRGDKQ